MSEEIQESFDKTRAAGSVAAKALDEDTNHDTKIFSLALLLSS